MSAGGFVARELERMRNDPAHVATVHNAMRRDCALLAGLARDRCTLRIPLPNVLAYAAAWRDEYGRAP